MKSGNFSPITGRNVFLTFIAVSSLIGAGLVLSHANAQYDIGGGVSGQGGVGVGTSSGGVNASTSAAVSAQAGTNVTSSSAGSSQGSQQSQEYGNTQATSQAGSQSHFSSSYQQIIADSNNSFTVQSDRHLYKPGAQIDVDGAIWSGLTTTLSGINTISIMVTDSGGNVVYTGNGQVNSNGQYSATFQLPSDAKDGTYTVNVGININATLLGAVKSSTQANLSQSTEFAVITPNSYQVKAEGQNFGVNIATNSSSVNNFNFDEQNKKISFTVQGQSGTKGVLDIDIPKPLLSGNLNVMIDGQAVVQSDIIETDAQDHTTLEINYHHSTHQIDIVGTNVVPEFSSLVPLVLVVSIISIIVISRYLNPIRI